jgi:hypothetical protein
MTRYRPDYQQKTFSCCDQYLSMAFAQLTYRESLRDVEVCLRSMQGKLYHMGFRGKVARSTLADANESRDATESGRPDLGDGSDYYDAFANYTEAFTFSQGTEGAEAPLALVRQLEYIEEPNPGEYRQVKGVRITEWHVEFLRRPRRTPNTIPDSYRRTRPPTGWIDAGVWQIRMSKTKPSVNRCNQPLAPAAVSE